MILPWTYLHLICFLPALTFSDFDSPEKKRGAHRHERAAGQMPKGGPAHMPHHRWEERNPGRTAPPALAMRHPALRAARIFWTQNLSRPQSWFPRYHKTLQYQDRTVLIRGSGWLISAGPRLYGFTRGTGWFVARIGYFIQITVPRCVLTYTFINTTQKLSLSPISVQDRIPLPLSDGCHPGLNFHEHSAQAFGLIQCFMRLAGAV
eukprot:2535332-Rhodomonas_salina.3